MGRGRVSRTRPFSPDITPSTSSTRRCARYALGGKKLLLANLPSPLRADTGWHSAPHPVLVRYYSVSPLPGASQSTMYTTSRPHPL